MKKKEKMYKGVKYALFLLDVFLALLIITTSTYLWQTTFGRLSMAFGFVMLLITTILKIIREW
ncbi:MAG: hypothetical protein Q7S74_06675 [Nanoarchaeota archaeon]|nr:hypothetical protein [Nanoarchaeota archaeon]